MNDRLSKHFFLGANTADGFYSLYDSLVSLDKGDFLWVIKGGAGCGKSSFMRTIGKAAESAGFAVEYIACSGDPDSLDGIFIPGLHTAYVDGTAPHIADVNLAGVNSSYLDLGRFYDLDGISGHKDELTKINYNIAMQYKKAYALLAAAGALRRGWLSSLLLPADISGAAKRVGGIIRRELGTRHRSDGRVTRRFLSAFTCHGLSCHSETAQNLCDRAYVFESRLGLSAPMLRIIADSAHASGFQVFECPDPLTPELLEAVFIPAAALGFISSGSALSALPSARRIHLDPKGDRATQKASKGELQRYEKALASLKGEALAALAGAKQDHDRLESIYNPYVNFDGVHEAAREHIQRLGLK